MAKVKTQINCPQCKQPITANIDQVIDVSKDPAVKQRFLAGQYNIVLCPHCGFNGSLSTPLVYHDAEKELLLTFIPQELNLPMPEQEKVLGKLINQVLESLPQEKRKGYLLNPQRVLTMQGLVERVLQEEGITKEMIEAQQYRFNLIQRLIAISDDDALAHVAEEEDEHIDMQFFAILSQLIEASISAGDQTRAEQFSQLQQRLMPITTIGKKLQAQSQEMESAINELRGLGKEVTREKLLDLVLAAPNEQRVDAYVSLARMGMDYQFFALLSEKIEAAEDKEKKRLQDLRTHLLEVTDEIDKQIQQRMTMARQNLEKILTQDNIPEVTAANLGIVDEYFLQVINQEYAAAREEKDTERENKIQQVIEVLSQISAAASGPDPELVQSLLDAKDAEERTKIMEDNSDSINQKLVEALSGLLVQLEGPENVEQADKVRTVYREAVRFSMQNMMKSAEENKQG